MDEKFHAEIRKSQMATIRGTVDLFLQDVSVIVTLLTVTLLLIPNGVTVSNNMSCIV